MNVIANNTLKHNDLFEQVVGHIGQKKNKFRIPHLWVFTRENAKLFASMQEELSSSELKLSGNGRFATLGDINSECDFLFLKDSETAESDAMEQYLSPGKAFGKEQWERPDLVMFQVHQPRVRAAEGGFVVVDKCTIPTLTYTNMATEVF